MARAWNEAPGLKIIRRKNGRTDAYWCADPKLVRLGYAPKTVRLFGDSSDHAVYLLMAARCQILWAQMLEWSREVPTPKSSAASGTLAWLIDHYQTDKDSPYRECRRSTQKFYDENLLIVRATVGQRRLDAITGKDVRRWYKEWRRPRQEGGSERIRRAYGCIQGLRTVLKFGVESGVKPCLALSQLLSDMRFENVGRRKHRLTFHQVQSFQACADRAGRQSMALALGLQYDLALRQKDVIGEWIESGSPGKKEGVSDGRFQWASGLTWGHIGTDSVLRKPTSKSNFKEVAEHLLPAYPDTLARLMAIPAERRVGPVIVNERTGKPYKKREFARIFRQIARAAGIPDEVRNMDARAGAITEAFEAGALPADVTKFATHRNITTSLKYNRTSDEQHSRVATKRQKLREREKNRLA